MVGYAHSLTSYTTNELWYSATATATATTTAFDYYQGGFSMPATATWDNGVNPAAELAALALRKLGRHLVADDLRDRWREWTKSAKWLEAYLLRLDVRDEALRSLARHMRQREPRRRPPRARARTCSFSSARAARPPEAVS